MPATLPTLPRYVTVFINWACNLRCRECWLYGDASADNDWLKDVIGERMPLSMWEALVDELAAHTRAPVISLMGGEPLLNKEAASMIRLAKERLPGCAIDMSTNGTLLPRYAEQLVEAGIDTVYVSLDGPTPEINDPIRGTRTHERALTGLRSLQDASVGGQPYITLNFTLTGMNYTALPEMVDLAESLSVTQLTVDLAMFFTPEEGNATDPAFRAVTGRPFTSWSGYCNKHQHANIDRAELKAILDETIARSPLVEVLVAPVRYSSHEKSHFFADSWPQVHRETTCPKLWAQTTVLPNGDVLSCTPFADTVMGSIADNSLVEVWNGEPYARMRELIRNELQPVCHRCCELSLDIGVDPNLFAASAVTR